MKKNILLATFCLAICNFMISVASAQSPLRLGLRLSPIVSFASVTDNDKNTINGVDASGRLGINGGLIGVYQFTDKFGIQSGLQICTRGFTVTRTGAEQSSQVTIVEIPALLHMRTNEISNGLRARGIFGSTIGILAGASSDIKVNGSTTSDKKGDNFSSLQFDFTFGAGAEWSLGNAGTFDFGLSYHLPLALMSDKIVNPNSGNGNGYSFQDARLKLGYLALDISYYF